MNIEMTKAIIDGRKTQTRRVIRTEKLGKIDGIEDDCLKVSRNYRIMIENYKIPFEKIIEQFSKYQKDEVIIIKEKLTNIHSGTSCYIEQHIFLKITDVRVERLRDINNKDIVAEGCITDLKNCVIYDDGEEEKSVSYSAYSWYRELWNKTAPKGYKWEDNPYVFVYEFERVNRDGSAL